MSIGRIICNTKMFQLFKGAKNVAKAIVPVAEQTAARVKPSIISRVETNVPGRVLRMQNAKQAFTPYQTTVTHESVPTLQKMEEITGILRGRVADATGYFDKKRAADALAAFKQEPIPVRQSAATVNYQPTQQVLDDMHNISKIEALKTYELTGKLSDLPKEVIQKRLAAQEAFSGDLNSRISRYLAKFHGMLAKTPKKLDDYTFNGICKIDIKNKFKCLDNLNSLKNLKQI